MISALRCVISETIGTAASASVGEFGGWLRVDLIKLGRLDEFVDQRVFNRDRCALIKALVRVCLDQSNEIGNEIVHLIIKGHLLCAFMSRPDLVAAVDSAGQLRGEKLIMDTPLLVRMLAGRTSSRPVLALLTSALALGMDVVLYQRTCDELNRVLDRAGHGDGSVIDEAMRSGADPEVLASLSRGNQITSAWLGWPSRSLADGAPGRSGAPAPRATGPRSELSQQSASGPVQTRVGLTCCALGG